MGGTERHSCYRMRCHGGVEVDVNGTRPEKAWRARKKAACWHYRYNMTYFPLALFLTQARSGAINLAANTSIHFVRGSFSVWLDCVASMRNVTGKKRARETACWHYQNNPTRRVARCKRTEQNKVEQNRAALYNIT